MVLPITWGVPRSATGYAPAAGVKPLRVLDLKAIFAEFVGMFLFVVIGCGTACGHGASEGETRLLVAFAFGMAIMVLAYAIGHHSGGQMNAAVTLSLVLGGEVTWYQGLANVGAQSLASIIAAGFLAAVFPCKMDMTTNLASNVINPAFSNEQVLLAEAIGTFLLCYTVWECAVTTQSSCGKNACIAIGFAVFLAHVVLLPIDGCSINPTRSLGPAFIAKFRHCGNFTDGGFRDLWVMWLGPAIGAVVATMVQYPFLMPKIPIDEKVMDNFRLGVHWGIDRSITGMAATGAKRPRVIDLKACAAEFLGMVLFIWIGCGAACSNGASDGETRLLVAFAFGMGIMVLAYVIGHHSGGHLNCAVTFSLFLGGQVPWYQALANLASQMFASVVGAMVLAYIYPCQADLTTTLGTNIINPNYNVGRVLFAEAFGTFILCYTVWETAVTPKASCGKNACIAIGFSVFLAHLLLLPVDGCSINPTRSFGPAIVGRLHRCDNYTKGGMASLWVMWLGPLFGAAVAAAVQYPFVQLDIDDGKGAGEDAAGGVDTTGLEAGASPEEDGNKAIEIGSIGLDFDEANAESPLPPPATSPAPKAKAKASKDTKCVCLPMPIKIGVGRT